MNTQAFYDFGNIGKVYEFEVLYEGFPVEYKNLSPEYYTFGNLKGKSIEDRGNNNFVVRFQSVYIYLLNSYVSVRKYVNTSWNSYHFAVFVNGNEERVTRTDYFHNDKYSVIRNSYNMFRVKRLDEKFKIVIRPK